MDPRVREDDSVTFWVVTPLRLHTMDGDPFIAHTIKSGQARTQMIIFQLSYN